jgi:ubiquinone/menaquinone biosynthesis C-methylase UbiE
MMGSGTEGTKTYFDKVPKEWDSLYSHENKFRYIINKWLRKGLFERYRLTFEHCGNLTGARVLDVGCGTGRFSIECAKRGAGRVVGIDFAPSMVEMSQETARKMNVSDKCEFICGDFLTFPFEESFDVILALGFFDYIEDPELLFKKIALMNPHKFIASFPKFTPIWGLQRAIRYYCIKKCPIYNYTREKLEQLYREAPFQNYLIIPCGRGFFCVAENERD